MVTPKDSVEPSGPVSDDANTNPRLSLDWWAVIFALALVTLVVAGLQVKW